MTDDRSGSGRNANDPDAAGPPGPDGAAGDRAPGTHESRASVRDRPLHSDALPDAVTCPFCEGSDTEQFSAFGGQASTSQYYCNSCRTVFEFLRWR